MIADHIDRAGFDPSNDKSYNPGKSLSPQKLWVATRSALDFNLHQSFELYLKLILKAEGTGYSHLHDLSNLFEKVSEDAKDAFEYLHNKHVLLATRPSEISTIAFNIAKVGQPWPTPPEVDINDGAFHTMRSTLRYFDKELELFKKRYGWEDLTKEDQWLYFIEDISPWIAVLEGLADYTAWVIRNLSSEVPSD
ncbi:MAG: hypothetical protein OXC14_16040 [Rhodospirillaceae bacterium]|nr:hypothetical protein [Rhodospirillaceae bacterium]